LRAGSPALAADDSNGDSNPREGTDLSPISPTEWIDARYVQLTPTYWHEHFTVPASSFSPPPRKMKSMYEYYHAGGFSWWLVTLVAFRLAAADLVR